MPLKLPVKYKWAEDDNGKFIIFKVPIFMVFDGNEEYGPVTNQDARDIVSNFKKDRDRGYYPVVHVEHHDEKGNNKENVGFADNFIFEEESGIIFCDFAEIHPEPFQKIKLKKYPSRSVEFFEEENRISSVALLESKEPFFRFSILALENEPIKITNFQAVLRQMRGKMKKKKVPKKFEGISEPAPAVEPGSAPHAELREEEEYRRFSEMMDRYLRESGIDLQKMKEYQESVTDKPDPGPRVPQISDSVAMQAFEKRIMKRLDTIENQSRTAKKYENKIRAACIGNASLQFDACMKQLEKFDTEASKDAYVEMLGGAPAIYGAHVATNFAKNFPWEPNNTIMAKYEKETESIRKLAERASRDYQETVGQTNVDAARKFQKIWNSEEKFIAAIVEGEKESPGYYDRVFMG